MVDIKRFGWKTGVNNSFRLEFRLAERQFLLASQSMQQTLESDQVEARKIETDKLFNQLNFNFLLQV